jgi:hypothetical protein
MRLLRLLPRIAALAALLAVTVPPAPAPAQVSFALSINIGPPAIPVYVQPPCPRPNYLWTPGYWAYGPYGYYWVPGAWVPAPYPGYLWTPGYWGWNAGYYAWHPGYWGRHVGFYGGINYGFGYFGLGFVGGAWAGNAFRYNTAVVNVNRTVIRNVYVNKTVINNNYYARTRVAYNGGPGGIGRRPLPAEIAASRETRVPPTAIQRQHIQVAQQNRNFLASVNRGRPTIGAVPRPLSGDNRPSNFVPVRQADRPHALNPGTAQNGEHPYRAAHPAYNENHMQPAHPYRDAHPGNNQNHPMNHGEAGPHHMNNGAAHPPAHAAAHPADHPHAEGDHPHEKPPRR